jgi:16S rRNA (guanine966-N2)-methyltransferase
MSLKILGGMARGLNLEAPDQVSTRPTSIMLRRKIFDAHQDLSTRIFYDLCAGSGAMGFEALSRGAENVTLVENNRIVLKYIEKNKIIMSKNIPHIEQKLRVSNLEVMKFLEFEKNNFLENPNVILYFDPPYSEGILYKKFYEKLRDFESFDGEIWIEACEQKTPADALEFPSFLEEIKRYNHSHHFIAILKMK